MGIKKYVSIVVIVATSEKNLAPRFQTTLSGADHIYGEMTKDLHIPLSVSCFILTQKSNRKVPLKQSSSF